MLRLPYIDLLKGIAMLMVIAVHCYHSFPVFGLPLRQLIATSVPLFVGINGYLNAPKIGQKLPWQRWFDKAWRIYLPCLLCSLPFLWQRGISGHSLIVFFLCGCSVYYFIFLLLQLNFIPYLVSNISRKGVVTAWLITMLWTIGYSYVTQVWLHLPDSLFFSVGLFPAMIGYYFLGAYLRNHPSRISSPLIVLTILAWTLCLIEAHFLNSFHVYGEGTKPSVVLFSSCVIVLLLSRTSMQVPVNLMTRSVLFVGRHSLAVYLIHPHVLRMMEAYLCSFPWAIRIFIVTLISSMIVVLIHCFGHLHND